MCKTRFAFDSLVILDVFLKKTIFEEKKPNSTRDPLPHLNAEVIKKFPLLFLITSPKI